MNQTPCQCAAYGFPHRAGGGRCSDPGPEPESCSDCGHARWVSDPYGTGDRWYSIIECAHPDEECPWGR